MTTASNDAAPGNEDWGPQHSRTVTWHDPGPTVARGLTMAGIDYLKAMIAGELPPPPIAALMQFDLVDAEPGKVVFTCQPDGSVYNPNGGVHGGLIAAARGQQENAGIVIRCWIRWPGWRCRARFPPARDTRQSRSR